MALAAEGGERVLIATGHPGGLDLLYREWERLLLTHGGRVIKPADGVTWRDPRLAHDWSIGYLSGVGMQTDGRVPRHTHWPDAMQRMLEAERPDLVVADHGFAGAAIEAGVETVSVADVNDPALLVAKAQGRTDVVVVMDDHVAADAYWPCFQAAAAAFPQVNGIGTTEGYPAGAPFPYNPPIVKREPFTEARLLTVNEVADLLRVSRMTVYRLIKTGEMSAFRVGRGYRLREEDIDSYLTERYTEAG